ncbi:MAG: hypothetical protein RDU14_01960 [Melioribacteraceae bacterium]|nr:hypothetical protein [Melioribacteraceae bacterium]
MPDASSACLLTDCFTHHFFFFKTYLNTTSSRNKQKRQIDFLLIIDSN